MLVGAGWPEVLSAMELHSIVARGGDGRGDYEEEEVSLGARAALASIKEALLLYPCQVNFFCGSSWADSMESVHSATNSLRIALGMRERDSILMVCVATIMINRVQ